MQKIKNFSLLDSKGNTVSTKDYIPISWYILENHYAHTIKINCHGIE